MSRQNEYIDKCTICGKDNTTVTIVDEKTHVCKQCLEREYFYCDECFEYWAYDFVDYHNLKDGRTVCEHCFEDYEESDEIDDDYSPNEVTELDALLRVASENEKYDNSVFEAPGIYFAINNGKIYEIPDDASCSPRGGWFPEIFRGPTDEQNIFIDRIITQFGIDESFFSEMVWDLGDDFETSDVFEYFEEDENALSIAHSIKRICDTEAIPFKSFEELIIIFERYGCNYELLYYMWEGTVIEMNDNIVCCGEPVGSYESFSTEKWIEIINNLDEYEVMPLENE